MERTSSAEKTRPADTTAYAAEDVISESTTAGTVWTFSDVVGFGGRGGLITKAIVQTDEGALTPQLSLLLFNAAPTTANLNDNAANTAPDYDDVGKFVGVIDFPAMTDLGGDSSWAVASLSADNDLPLAFKCADADVNLYGILVAQGALTPVSTQKVTITLQTKVD